MDDRPLPVGAGAGGDLGRLRRLQQNPLAAFLLLSAQSNFGISAAYAAEAGSFLQARSRCPQLVGWP